MLLQCEMENGAPAGGALAWLREGTLESLVELNESCLTLLAEQAAVRTVPPSPLLRQVGELWRMLDGAARRRAAACPYLLLDAGFADAVRWRPPPAQQVGDAGRALYTSYFTVPGATHVARLVFTYAWHLARSQGPAARVLLGMPAPCAALIGHRTLGYMQALAETRPDWLKPRWPARVQIWRDLLVAAGSGEGAALERARLRGLTLLAAEVRLAPSARS
jgi:hypothetical protein